MRSSVPKVLHPVAGVPMVRHVARVVRALKPASLLLVVSPASRDRIAAAGGDGVECVEQPDPLGTGHALASALPLVSPQCEHLLVLGADTPLLRVESLGALLQRHRDAGATLTVLTATLPADEATDLGQLRRDGGGRPISIVEAAEAKPGASGPVEANLSVYCMERSLLGTAVEHLAPHADGEYYATDLLALAREEGRPVEALALEDPQEGLGVNTQAQLARAEAGMQERLRRHWMDRGVTLRDPATTYLDATVEIGEDTVVLPNTSIHGDTRIGRGVTVGPNAVLTDATIGDRCTIGASVVEGAVVEEESQVGPFCHIRPGSHLERNVHLGSHVETKSSRLGSGTRVGHFSYIGDAILGPRVNIGAGTITCNYDGALKHPTEIGEGALIGSDTLLVAPVKVGARAITGAGAVITRDVSPDAIVVGVPARELMTSQRSRRGARPAVEEDPLG